MSRTITFMSLPHLHCYIFQRKTLLVQMTNETRQTPSASSRELRPIRRSNRGQVTIKPGTTTNSVDSDQPQVFRPSLFICLSFPKMIKLALGHVSLAFALFVALANTGLFDRVAVDLSYEHYAEPRVEHLPSFLAMPCNCLVNVAYIVMGLYWLRRPRAAGEAARSLYVRQVFALMALFYAPVQWTRLASLRRVPAVLDQWLTLPIFAWVPVWIHHVERLRSPGRSGGGAGFAASLEAASALSYGLALLHERGFEVALVGHVALALYGAVRLQRAAGDGRTRRDLLLAVLSCGGFVALKLLDQWLADRFSVFRRLTGHFWSKVCDVLQFHFSFRFLTTLTRRAEEESRRLE